MSQDLAKVRRIENFLVRQMVFAGQMAHTRKSNQLGRLEMEILPDNDDTLSHNSRKEKKEEEEEEEEDEDEEEKEEEGRNMKLKVTDYGCCT